MNARIEKADTLQDNHMQVIIQLHVNEAIVLASLIAYGLQFGPKACMPEPCSEDDRKIWMQCAAGMRELATNLIRVAMAPSEGPDQRNKHLPQ
jgi:hypothetical protein